MLPELHWEGKAALKDKIKNIPLRLLNFKPDLSCGDNSENMIIHGDNLDAMKALLPLYRARVKCIYIDPPYNTGAAFENYNDNFPHADWLNEIYPRLQLLREFLSDDGAIFISIDDTEQAYLKIICDEIFGRNNFQANITYVRKTSGKQDSRNFVKSTEYILVYSKKDSWQCNEIIAEEKVTSRYNKTDDEGRKYRETDLRKTGTNDRREDRPNMFYPFYYDEEKQILSVEKIENAVEILPIRGDGTDGRWRWSKETAQKVLSEKQPIEILPIKTDGTEGCWRWQKETAAKNIDRLVAKIMPKYKNEKKYTVYEKDFMDKRGEVVTVKEHTFWNRTEFNSDNAAQEFKNLGFGNKVFAFPKSSELIKHIIYLSTDKNSIILDAYAGSGTTAHAVINLNNQDGGSRRFILIEEKAYCETITAERVKRIGGDYKYYEIGEKILEGGTINPAVTNEELAKFIWYSETQTPLKKINSAQLGIYEGAAIYLLHGETNILTQEILAKLPPFDGAKIIYGAACRIDEKFLKDKKITFRQIPQDLKLS